MPTNFCSRIRIFWFILKKHSVDVKTNFAQIGMLGIKMSAKSSNMNVSFLFTHFLFSKLNSGVKYNVCILFGTHCLHEKFRLTIKCTFLLALSCFHAHCTLLRVKRFIYRSSHCYYETSFIKMHFFSETWMLLSEYHCLNEKRTLLYSATHAHIKMSCWLVLTAILGIHRYFFTPTYAHWCACLVFQ